MPNSSSMSGKVCLVTGATSGIGLVAARELARQGALVVIVGRNKSRTDAALTRIRAESGNQEVTSLLADLSLQGQVRELARQFQEKHRRLDVLVNNAGRIWFQR